MIVNSNLADIRLSDKQWAIMDLLWQEIPLAEADLRDQLLPRGLFNNSPADLQLNIADLETKGAIRRIDQSRYAPRITLEQACQATAKHLLDTLPSSAILPVVLLLVQSFDLSPGLRDQIKALLEMVVDRDSV